MSAETNAYGLPTVRVDLLAEPFLDNDDVVKVLVDIAKSLRFIAKAFEGGLVVGTHEL